MKRKSIFRLAILPFALAVFVGCSQPSEPPKEPTTATLEVYLSQLNTHNKMMSAVVVSRDGEPMFEHYNGQASIEEDVSITANTRFRVGSITKTFTSVLIMQLIESSQLTLETPLAHFFPKVANAERITIKHLLNHRSGIHSFTDDAVYLTYMTAPQSQQQMLERIESFQPVFEPDSEQRYSNSNYVLLGYIIEAIYGMPYGQVITEKISQPLGLTQTGFGDRISTANSDASSYRFSGEWQLATETHMSVPHAAGAIVSTAREINSFIIGLFNGKLVSEASLNQMMALQDGYGLGLFAMPFYSHSLYGHNGSIDGFVSNTAYNPVDGVAMTVLSNAVNTAFNDVLIAVLSEAYGKSIEMPDFSHKPIELDSQLLTRFEGVYASDDLPMDIQFRIENEQLMAQATGQSALPLKPYSETEFRFDPAGIVIVFDPDSVADNQFERFTLTQAGGNYVFTRKPE